MKIRSHYFACVLFAFVIIVQGCKKEEVIDRTIPNGEFTVAMTGTFVDQNSAGSAGTVELGTDEDGTQFAKFNTAFKTNFATGTVVVYLSTSANYSADPAAGNPNLRLIGYTTKAGEQYFRLDTAAEAKFTHVLLYCASAGVQFGNAALN